MNDEIMLRQKVREAIQAERLPASHPEHTWGGPGSGAECTLCGAVIGPDALELELEFGRGNGGPGAGSYHVHTKCFAIWESERSADQKNAGSNGDTDPTCVLQALSLTADGSVTNPGSNGAGNLPRKGHDGTIAGSEREPGQEGERT